MADWSLDGNPNTDPTQNFLGTTDNNSLIIKTNGVEAIRINPGRVRQVDDVTLTTGGDVGIGTTDPTAKLHVSSGGDFTSPQAHIQQTRVADFARLRFNSTALIPGDPDNPQPSRPGALPLWDIAVGGLRNVMNLFFQNLGNILTLTPDGRVGIRTEDPTTELHVNGTATVDLLQITGGSDLAEPFPVGKDTKVEPGSIMVIDEKHPGKLRISETAYDRKVAGIISGAGGLKAGLRLRQGYNTSDAEVFVAMAGCVYCKAEASMNPIEPGDLLTTSSIPGHAMKALDRQNSQGAILGKAMSSLKEGRGLVLVLANLQ
jgi:hypothetical protein